MRFVYFRPCLGVPVPGPSPLPSHTRVPFLRASLLISLIIIFITVYVHILYIYIYTHLSLSPSLPPPAVYSSAEFFCAFACMCVCVCVFTTKYYIPSTTPFSHRVLEGTFCSKTHAISSTPSPPSPTPPVRPRNSFYTYREIYTYITRGYKSSLCKFSLILVNNTKKSNSNYMYSQERGEQNFVREQKNR